ncbi:MULTISPECIES: hypothetical protein [Sinorhizobium]|uniref:Uncharacterized protein n=2 Tax=Sinorhizobium TaxID=28105 RepID=E4MVE3_RHIML|nr:MULTISPECIES: hypothetical protein [Sinorhizobium]AGA08383.1 hypothetical protein C770_GR4pA071 [Sinorhizobium meliloti GR4]MDE3832116.1 hypothetical protein [Sinorhizobium meliloti]MDE4580241.1 hypothetical protein [Sinorhizobium meliloti]CBY17645.1 hypothetical protein [Sinorhizobium meliloti]VTZ59883.1 conserved hypothetical protein [Sinorhizobium medicae]
MLGRGFLLGVAVGCVLGVYVAPYLSRPTVGVGKVSGSILAQVNEAPAVPKKGTCPTDDQAKTQLFALSKWDLNGHGNGSTVSVERCMQIADQEIACELSAQLKWIDGETQIKAVFQEEGGDWKMIAAKNR